MPLRRVSLCVALHSYTCLAQLHCTCDDAFCIVFHENKNLCVAISYKKIFNENFNLVLNQDFTKILRYKNLEPYGTLLEIGKIKATILTLFSLMMKFVVEV